MIDRWDRERQAAPDASRIILIHIRDEVRSLNELARDRLRAAGELGEQSTIATTRGQRDFAVGDRVMFLRNERGLEVKNGTLGRIEQVSGQNMTVRTDAGRSVAFDTRRNDVRFQRCQPGIAVPLIYPAALDRFMTGAGRLREGGHRPSGDIGSRSSGRAAAPGASRR